MRTGDGQEAGDDYLLPQKQSIDLPMPPFPVHPAPTSPSPPPGMMAVSDNTMSPDEMLRAYATRKITSPPTSPIAFPARALSFNGSSMRTLYHSTSPTPDSTSDAAVRFSVTQTIDTEMRCPSSYDAAVRLSVTQTTDTEKRYTSSYASVDPYAGPTA